MLMILTLVEMSGAKDELHAYEAELGATAPARDVVVVVCLCCVVLASRTPMGR